MPDPLTPEPSGRSSSVRRTTVPPPADSTSAHPSSGKSPLPGINDTTAIINNLIHNRSSADEDAPTIISSLRPKAGPDAQHAESLVGRKLGHFELIESVGIGGMAAVLRAHDLDLGRTVALKILPPDMAADPENVSRFKQEARSAARLDHENVARVYFCGEDQGLHFIAFEFVEGENLRVRMEKFGGLLPVAESLHYLIQIAAGLAHAASRGIVHRDIKPSNIIITPEGKAKIVDMGLARNLDSRALNGQLTQSGVTLGTFDYISPEQALEPRSADCRSDIYSLGCTFYHVMTGRLPVPEGTAAKKLHYHQHVAPLDPRELNPNIPDEMAAVLGKMMAKDPAQRYQDPDRLLQHLAAVAKKLNVTTGALVPDAGTDLPLPKAPSLSPLWIGTAVVALLVGLFAIAGSFGDGKRNPLDSTPFWQTEKPTKETTGPILAKETVDPSKSVEAPVQSKGPREARNTAELIALLKQPSAHIKLKAGVVYDLAHASRKNAEFPQAIFEGSNLVLENDQILQPPTIKLRMADADDGKMARFGTLTLRGPADGSPAKVRLRGIRFEFSEDEAEVGQTGISLSNFDRIDVEECTFVPPLKKGFPSDGPAAFAIAQPSAKEIGTNVRFDRCYFAPGSVAVQISGAMTIEAKECAFGPQFAAFRIESSGDSERRPPVQLRLESCSMLMSRGAVVEIGDRVPCKVRAGWCLFSNPELADLDRSNAFAIRQLGTMAPETRFNGGQSNDAIPVPMPNGYQNVLAYANGERSLTFDDCRTESIPVEDGAARILTKHPWKEEQPVARLEASPLQFKQIFRIDLKQEILRLEPDKNRNLLGTKHLPGTSVYDLFPFESPVPENRLAANHKIWNPSYTGDEKKLPANTYVSLVKAIDDLKKGDVLLIRHNGDLLIDPVEFKKADTEITIRPDDNYRPVLIPKASTLRKETALFKLYGGQIVLENLRFRLKADRPPAVVAIPGGGHCSFRNCTATLEEGEDLALVSLADPRGEMMMMGTTPPEKWPAPKIVIENTFIRGRGRALHVHGSRPFDLKVKNSLVVLDGSLIGVEASQADLNGVSPVQATLERTTTFLTKSLLSQKATEKRTEAKGMGLVRIQIHATQCLFVPAADQAALVNLDHIDTMEQMESVFQWKECTQNVYGFKPDQALLILQPDNNDTAMPLERLVRDRWFAKWRETEYAFGEVNFSVLPASKRFDGTKPGDFELKSISPPLKPEAPTEFGAAISSLPKLAPEE